MDATTQDSRSDPPGEALAPPLSAEPDGPNESSIAERASEASGGSAGGRETPDPRRETSGSAPEARVYDFSQHPLLSAHELRKLEAQHVEFLHGLNTRLSMHFHLEMELSLVTLLAPSFRQFISGLSQPSHLMLFKIEPLRGICLFEIAPALGLRITDRLMGGSGQFDYGPLPPTLPYPQGQLREGGLGGRGRQTQGADRALSQIETALLSQIAQFVIEDWCGHFESKVQSPKSKVERREPTALDSGLGTLDFRLRPVMLGHESDPQYLQTSPPESSTLVVTINARLAECTGRMHLAFPITTLDPLIQKSRAELKPVSEVSPETATPKEARWNPVFAGVNVSIAAELLGPEVPASEISRLKIGEVLHLPGECADHVQLRLAGLPRYRGRLGKRNDRWAVEVTQILKS